VGVSLTVRALIIDDHALFSEAIRSTLEDHGIRVIGAPTTATQALQAVRDEKPDLVLVDLGLPDMSGLALGQQILRERPETKVVVLTALEDPRAVKEALRAGFHGYVTKDTPVEGFVDAVLAILGGQVVVPHGLAARAAGSGVDGGRGRPELLTTREREVLTLLATGATGARIALEMGIAPNTVRTHISNILTKLQVHTRLEAAAYGVRHGIVQPGAPLTDHPYD
jgi:DNA-binding NarL/FixJ family response regulator